VIGENVIRSKKCHFTSILMKSPSAFFIATSRRRSSGARTELVHRYLRIRGGRGRVVAGQHRQRARVPEDDLRQCAVDERPRQGTQQPVIKTFWLEGATDLDTIASGPNKCCGADGDVSRIEF
jgi:hypothetical protein